MLCLCLAAAQSFAADASVRNFDLPVDTAENSLRKFSSQSGMEIVFGSSTVGKIQTNAVKGTFVPRAALDRLIEGTGLVVEKDPASGALMVIRDPKGVRAPLNSDRPAKTAKTETATITGRVQNVVTGKYLENARVSVHGTDQVAPTDSFGSYRLLNVRSGAVVLEVFYTDLDLRRVPVNVTDGARIEQDVGLTSVARYGANGEVVKLNSFVVMADRDADSQATATNEQRFAPNIKTVVATDALGDVLAGSVGEFLKYMPGVTAEHAGNEITGISIRGIDGAMSSFTTDGAPMVFASYAAAERSYNMYTSDLNNASRIEITKVPTPSTPADALAGSVNIVSKSAFERDQPQFRVGLTLLGNSKAFSLRKTPSTIGDKHTHKVFPGGNFDYTLPLTKNFGIVLTGLHVIKTAIILPNGGTYNVGGTGTGASISRPYLQQFSYSDGMRTLERTNLGFKADWRVAPNSVLSLGLQWSEHETNIANNNLTFNVGTVAAPLPATGVPFSFGDDFTIGATGRGAVTQGPGNQTFGGGATSPALTFRHDDGRWKVEAGVNYSSSRIARDNVGNGHFLNLPATFLQPVRVTFEEATPQGPGIVKVFDDANRQVDPYNLANFTITGATEAGYARRMKVDSGNLKVKRRFDYFPFASALEMGAYRRVQRYASMGSTQNWTFNGPDGNPATREPATPYGNQVFVNQDERYGLPNIGWVSTYRAWEAFQANPTTFSQTPAQVVAQETTRIMQSQAIEEAVDAYYLQAEASLLQNRLTVLTGMRFERTTDDGTGPLFDPNAVFLRNADGSFARNAQGARIRRSDAGAVGSMDELRFTRKERAFEARRSYDGYYPSLHLTYSVTSQLLARAAYARTYGRPNFASIIPNATVNEADVTTEDVIRNPSLLPGTISVTNTGLLPWTANNYDLSLEYYTEQGGVFSAGGFVKDITDFFGTAVKIATEQDIQEFGLDSRYVGWSMSSTFNSGDAQISGVEFNIRHSLRPLGQWGRYFTVFANGTRLWLKGDQQASFSSFITKTGNWGVSFTRKRLTIGAKWNHTGLNKLVARPPLGPGAFRYNKAVTQLDLNIDFQLTNRFFLAATVTNALGEPVATVLDYGPDTPAYARQISEANFGIPIAITIKGIF